MEWRELRAVLHCWRRWWKPAVRECAPARDACSSRVHHRSPGVLAVSPPRSRAARNRERPFSMDQRGANRRTWRFQLDRSSQLETVVFTAWRFSRNNNQVRSDAQCGSSQRSCSRFIPRGDTRRVISVRSDAQCDLFRVIFATRQLQRGALKIFDLETSARWRLHRRSVHRTGRIPAVYAKMLHPRSSKLVLPVPGCTQRSRSFCILFQNPSPYPGTCLRMQSCARGRIAWRPGHRWELLHMWQTQRVVGCKDNGKRPTSTLSFPGTEICLKQLGRRHLLERGCICRTSKPIGEVNQIASSPGLYVAVPSLCAVERWLRHRCFSSVAGSSSPSRGSACHQERPFGAVGSLRGPSDWGCKRTGAHSILCLLFLSSLSSVSMSGRG